MSLFRIAGAVAVGAVLLSAAPPPRSRQPNIILIVIDTLRYDAVTPETTPFLASLRNRGVIFTHAYSTHDFTPTSHFSIFTGLRDGIDSDYDRPELAVPWQLQHAGYATFALAANDLIATDVLPVMRGFASYQQHSIRTTTALDATNLLMNLDMRMALFQCRPTQRNRAMLYFASARLLPDFVRQIEAAKTPYLGFVNLLDPHEPYVPDPDYYAPETTVPPGFNGDVLKRRLPVELQHPETIADPQRRAFVESLTRTVKYPHLLALDLSPDALATYHHRYLGKIKKTDAMLQQFFATLEGDKRLDNTIVIITSDHGEEFGESHFVTHMLQDKGDYEATHHVPLIVVLPPPLPRKAAVVDRVVGIEMLAPTIYELAGIDAAPLRKQLPALAPSLTRFITTRAAPSSKASIPRNLSPLSSVATDREQAMRALGYLQ